MKSLILVCLLGTVFPAFSAKALKVRSPIFLSQNESAFDPFIDYGEFQDNVTEQENISFFQNGRSLNVSLFGTYEALSFNISQIYGDSPFIFGVALSFFFDLHFSFQIQGFFPYQHYNSLLNANAQFSHFGIDLKYYLNKQYSGKNKDFFNPYFSFGPFWLNIKNPIPRLPSSGNIPITTGQTPVGNPQHRTADKPQPWKQPCKG